MKQFKQVIVDVAEICAQRNVVNFVISPGSRSAPLTLAFLRHPKITCRTIVDERSAGFVALGLAQQFESAVGLVCTSGTAALNYLPAISEACYQRVPLLVFTADRPPEWLDQEDGQTIHQRELYGKFCRASFELPVETAHPDAKWHVERLVSEAINATSSASPGPVHINVPLREPLYPVSPFQYQNRPKVITRSPSEKILPDKVWRELVSVWQNAGKKLIVAGLQKPSEVVVRSLRRIAKDASVAVHCDVASNLHQGQRIHHSDMILGTENETVAAELATDLLVSFGGPVVSKNLKLFLRKHQPGAHWQIQTHDQHIDTFQSLTRIVPVSPDYFFDKLASLVDPPGSGIDYSGTWSRLETTATGRLDGLLEALPHCELTAMSAVLEHLPKGSHLQLGNSFIVRLASFIGLAKTQGIKVNSNRGTSGIDGTLSTTVGAALASPNVTTLVTGDLAFFYDRNALWQDSLPPNLRIIIINNYGGGIFRILDGPNQLPELRQHFEVEHELTARNSAEDHALDYFRCDSRDGLAANLPAFFQSRDRAAILEVHTDKHVNAETFHRFKVIMKELG